MRFSRSLTTYFAVLLIGFALVRPAAAQSYRYTLFQAPGAAMTDPLGINDAGAIVGNAYFGDSGTYRGFLRDTSGNVTFLPTVSGFASLCGAYNINNNGQIVGAYDTPDGKFHAYLNTGGNLTTIDYPNAIYTDAWGINDAGFITGTWSADGNVYSPYIRDPQGNFITFSVGGPDAVFWESYRINNSGEVVGRYDVPSAFKSFGFVRDPDGTITTLDLAQNANEGTLVQGLNNLGQITGITSPGIGGTGFVRNPDGTIIRIPTPTINGDFFGNFYINDINNSGVLIGQTDLNFNGNRDFAWIATPAPEPATALFLLALLPIAVVHRRSRSIIKSTP